MKHISTPLLILISFFALSCGDDEKTVVTKAGIEDKLEDDAPPPPPLQPTDSSIWNPEIAVKAFLIYEDGTQSSFDVLNDSTIALWNTIIGAGDAVKPSEKLNVVISGKLENLHVKIWNGLKLVIDQAIDQSAGTSGFILNDTGCQLVRVEITKNGKTVVYDEVPFRCGE